MSSPQTTKTTRFSLGFVIAFALLLNSASLFAQAQNPFQGSGKPCSEVDPGKNPDEKCICDKDGEMPRKLCKDSYIPAPPSR